MRQQSRKIKIGIFICLFLISVFSSSFTIQAMPRTLTDSQVYSMEFLSAEYLDADEDGSADDTRFFVDIYFGPIFDGRNIKLNCLFDIILPSGKTLSYSGFIILSPVSCVIQFDVFDTVTEPGWYTINFHSNIQYRGYSYHSFCSTIFDPPTGHGEGGGTPTIGI
jgi:hypothetical protein